MAADSHRTVSPRKRIDAECARRGNRAVVQGCVQLVYGLEVDRELLLALGGPGARKFLGGEPHDDVYWLRVWGTRGLLWSWDDIALAATKVALRDEVWRVREMAAKVVARHLLGDLLSDVVQLRADSVPRVRLAADRAITRLTQASA